MGADRPTPSGVTVVLRHGVAALDKGMAIARVLRLVAKHHSNAEPINTALPEY